MAAVTSGSRRLPPAIGRARRRNGQVPGCRAPATAPPPADRRAGSARSGVQTRSRSSATAARGPSRSARGGAASSGQKSPAFAGVPTCRTEKACGPRRPRRGGRRRGLAGRRNCNPLIEFHRLREGGQANRAQERQRDGPDPSWLASRRRRTGAPDVRVRHVPRRRRTAVGLPGPVVRTQSYQCRGNRQRQQRHESSTRAPTRSRSPLPTDCRLRWSCARSTNDHPTRLTPATARTSSGTAGRTTTAG